MEVSETLKKAWAAVEEAGLPETIQEAAFREAVRLLAPAPVMVPAGSGRVGRPGQTGGGSGGLPTGSSSTDGGTSTADSGDITLPENELLAKVATQTNVAQEKLEELVHVDDGVLKISLPGIKLGKNNADKTRTIAQILTIVRGFGMDEDGTSVELIRNEAQRVKCYDSANFSSHLSTLQGYVIAGSGTNRRIRSKAAGIQAFPAIVDALLGTK
jgi:hypothetical protein